MHIPGTADPEGPLDAEGADEPRAFVLQARVFLVIGGFMIAAATGYGAWTREPAGTALLALSGGLAFTTAGYLAWPRHGHSVQEDGAADQAVSTAPEQPVEAEPWFPSASIWPFAVGAAAFLFANGILLGLWLLLPSGFVLAAAICGFAAQSRRRTS